MSTEQLVRIILALVILYLIQKIVFDYIKFQIAIKKSQKLDESLDNLMDSLNKKQ